MKDFPKDIFTEPQGYSVNTLENLGAFTGMAGIWEGIRGMDLKPKADGPREQAYVEHIELQPIDPQTNGPQLFYGLRYHSHITKPEQIKTYHDQVGYWLWEPATSSIIHTLTIPRGMTTMACGKAMVNDRQFALHAKEGDPCAGISSSPFLDYAFKTVEFHIQVNINADGTWSYEQDTVLKIKGQEKLFHHIDKNTLYKIGEASPNPLAR
ncbi:FABP family protein [Polynucleobacter nymphae]|uniref:FABP family protein n=1 Tax=Polynucleobacter nymphae TaxID=2081043 RepID=UPI001C0AF3DD|nr:heme-binding beta-barrel domain-containing protein [Polynucleobacter nymphae]MBU3607434.1 FABP family protein [Polynucleobacter nymphae]